jgi:hypothetical protein
MNPTVQHLSNEEFISGGLYPGGHGSIASIKYVLWDYAGKQAPDSVVAVKVTFQPDDNSNDGKPVEIYWSAGSATNAVPDHDGKFLLPVSRPGREPVKGISDNCNWKQVYEAFKHGCAMPPGSLDGPQGILALTGTRLSITRVDQKERDFADQDNVPEGAPGRGGAGQQKRKVGQVLVPTRVDFYPWDTRGRGVTQATAVPSNTAPTAAPVAVAHTNGAATPGDHTATLSQALGKALNASPEGIPFADIAAKVTEQLTIMGIVGKSRALMMKNLKTEADIAALAGLNGWTWDDADKTIYA